MTRRPVPRSPVDTSNVLLSALAEHAPFGAVVIDEGQDFNPAWLQTLEQALERPDEDHYYIFFDDNQRVVDTPGSGFGGQPYRLTRNLRNTRAIFEAARPYYSGTVHPSGPDGVPVRWHPVAADQTATKALGSTINHLTRGDHILPTDIAVLVGSDSSLHALTPGSRLGAFDTVRADSPDQGSLIVDTVERFKGLEAKVVVLAGLDSLLDHPDALYVALTRARSLLVVIGSQSELAVVDRTRKSRAAIATP